MDRTHSAPSTSSTHLKLPKLEGLRRVVSRGGDIVGVGGLMAAVAQMRRSQSGDSQPSESTSIALDFDATPQPDGMSVSGGAHATDDGRVELDVKFSSSMHAAAANVLQQHDGACVIGPHADRLHDGLTHGDDRVDAAAADLEQADACSDSSASHGSHGDTTVPPQVIVILITGTRGDVQPFVAIGRRLQQHGHRVRLASHAVYRDFVTSFGLEFYPLGGDPKVLSEYIVKNGGVLPTSSLPNPSSLVGELKTQHKQLHDICFSTFDACTKRDPDDEHATDFTATAIIANPPTLGLLECAQKLAVPLHVMFTMPWTPTSAFAHPMSTVTASIADEMDRVWRAVSIGSDGVPMAVKYANKLSYYTVNQLLWQGQYDIVRSFRKSLELPSSWKMANTFQIIYRKTIATTYLWSPALVPKPKDWGDHISVAGFVFLNQAQLANYEPHAELAAFLANGTAPVYIGFGSLVIAHPKQVTQMLFEAVQQVGCRALISKGWANLGEGVEVPDSILLVDNVPHDWLFPRCCAVVHHGGAGTTAAGLIAGKPTCVVPFFGDQPFWGRACERAGVGPTPIPITSLTASKLAAAITAMQQHSMLSAAQSLARSMMTDDGVENAVAAFHKFLLRDLEHGVPYKSSKAAASCEDAAMTENGDVTAAATDAVVRDAVAAAQHDLRDSAQCHSTQHAVVKTPLSVAINAPRSAVCSKSVGKSRRALCCARPRTLD